MNSQPRILTLLLLVCISLPGGAWAQDEPPDGYLGRWFENVRRTQAEQPHWITPMFTTTPRLEEEFRYDISRQSLADGETMVNYGGGKGLELIPAEHIEVILGVPPYLSHSSPVTPDGFGDVSFLLKYRILASNEGQHNYIVTAFLGASLPTGSYSNGAEHAVITPTIAFGKGWGNFDFQSTAGVGIPTGDVDRLGTPVAYNTAFQYRLWQKLWPEVEVNSTFWMNGERAGKKQLFLSPGLVVGRLHLWRRLGLTVGGGVQIAATQFHTYNHNWALSVRFPF
ncbi:MAG TPA: transporter [Terriglobales bacterium]|jgi:hypothetical protein|nr:transporter [Terriglobales bacterium]